ncbi:MAG: hypothetical protein FJX80_12205 [Bacteroidetes bacterium]|nr:hypothetical protein [Bacteroidota bacterium]
MSKNPALQITNPKDEKVSGIISIIVLILFFLILLFPVGNKEPVIISDPVVETPTFLDEIVMEPASSGGSSSSSDASPSKVEGQIISEGDRSTTITKEGKSNGTGKGDNPFGQGVGEKGSSVFGGANSPDDQSDETNCDNKPINLNTIINQLKKNVPVTKPTSATVTIKIKADGSVSSVKVSGLNAAEADIEKKIKAIVAQTKCRPCNGKNKNSRTFPFPKILLIQN